MQLETKSGENKGGSKLGTLRYRSWRTRITESPNTGLIMTAPCEKKHLGFTKNCQNLRPRFLKDKPDMKAASKWTKNHRQMWKKFVGKVMWFGGSWICQHSTLAVTGEDVISHSMPFSWVPTYPSINWALDCRIILLPQRVSTWSFTSLAVTKRAHNWFK